ncbi:MAG: aldose epimerase [Bacteroides sp. SM23_62_1]|nr:MAG: aldose epimerase [Bacteroides sp. SM23_62_1]
MKKIIFITIIFLLGSCQPGTRKAGNNFPDIPGMVNQENFQGTYKDCPTDLYTISNTNGLVMQATNYGGKIVTLFIPDRDGNMGDVVFGYPNIGDYLDGDPYFGAIVGRYANRINAGRFTLDNTEYQLPLNEGGRNMLHGGNSGFDDVVWTAVQVDSEEGKAVKLTYLSPDGDQGFPGNLEVEVIYTLTDENELIVDYRAVTDQPTIINLSQHSYFNLAGHGAGSILDHELVIHADYFTPVDENLIPTGELRPVEGTPFDFRSQHKIGERIEDDYEQLKTGRGYDHNFILKKDVQGELSFAGSVYNSISGRLMEVFTTHPAMQFYTGNFLDGSATGKDGAVYHYRTGFCLETQFYPDSPNHPEFPSTVLRPGEEYKHRTIFKFSTK